MNVVVLAARFAPPLAKSGEAAKSGPIGLAVILILCVGCYFLFKSMSKHLRIVREEFPDEPESTTAPTTPGPVPAPVREAGGGPTSPNKAVIVPPVKPAAEAPDNLGPDKPSQLGP